jgi:hypothetical protein
VKARLFNEVRMKRALMALLFGAWVMFEGAGQAAEDSMEEEILRIVRGRAGIPPLQETQERAVLAMGVDEDGLDPGWAGRSRLRGLLPRVEARMGSNQDQDVRIEDLDISSRRTNEGQALALDLGVRFELGDLIFSDQELRANRELLARGAAVRVAKERVTKFYFARLRVLLLLRAGPTQALLLEAARLDGLLNALTGGYWYVRSAKE